MSYPLLHSHILFKKLLQLAPKAGPAYHYLYLVGENVSARNDTDRDLPFRQESNFFWLSGCDVPGSALVLSYEHHGAGQEIDEAKIKADLYLPAINPDEVVWCGLPPAPEDFKGRLTLTSITQGWSLPALTPPGKVNNLQTYLHTLPWTAPPTKVVATLNGPIHTTQYLLPALHAARRVKTPHEIELMRKASDITAAAHTSLMRSVINGTVTDENAAEALFVSECRRRGAKWQAYDPIMAAGASAGTLHYVKNNAPFPSEPTLLLVDAGCECNNYAADVTRCIPIGNGGKFTPECRAIYELVLKMQQEAFSIIKAGTSYEDVQLLMHRVATQGLLDLGIFVRPASFTGTDAELVAEILRIGLSTAFYPHGIGHMLGLDVHDVGGLPDGNSKDPLLRYLRLRVPLEPGFVITVEPGVYFNRFMFKKFENSEFVNTDVLDKYWYVGGVRIEDNIVVTHDGFDNLTPSTLPKSVESLEALYEA